MPENPMGQTANEDAGALIALRDSCECSNNKRTTTKWSIKVTVMIDNAYNPTSTIFPPKASLPIPELNKLELTRIDTTDVSQQADALPKWDQQYLQISPGEFCGSLMDLSLGPIQLFREAMNKSVDQHGQPWPNSFVIGVPINVEGEGFWSGDALTQNSIFTLRTNTELKFKTPQFSDIFVSVISLDLFEHYLEMFETVDPEIAMALNGVEPSNDTLCHALRMRYNMLFSVALENPAVFSSPAVKRTILNDFLTGTFETIYGLGKIAPHQSRQNVHRYIVERSREYILSRKENPPTVIEICEEIKISRRTLHYSFCKVLGINPVTYLRYLRLNGARKDIINASGEGERIGDIASRWGFWHMGMFSTYYKQLFGETPSNTRHSTPKPRITRWTEPHPNKYAK